MQFRTFGRTGWRVSEMGYGMWGLAGWTGNDITEIEKSLNLSVELGCNFFDTAWGYGAGKSEEILGELVRRYADKRLYVATKIPPKNFKWPSKRGYTLDDCFPPDHIREYTEKSLRNLGVETIDLQQFHVWEDAWAKDERWQRTVEDLKREGKIQAMGVSVNRWEPDNVLDTLRTGLIDAVQVIYNIFDQAPEDHLLPLCETLNVGVIARVPFDEGTLTGTLTTETTFPPGDWRGTYFVEENLRSSVAHADALRPLIPGGMTMAELALRFILSNPMIHTTIPGMRKEKNVRANMGAADGNALSPALLAQLKGHRWDRTPTEWSQ
ncbi:aldo/keto reductase [Dinghuibacter silviterrae]|uniref:Aryl-alcohol dehydrogenase-like predicted oxidoreductase n=1 Tax=Dinghuibacter silviterrae TaxID=1539049 RepID=A0A4R8DVD4_9BACT|nr:aldo/keto reductase [Dinghuibacter silviterrae]TDX01976.1 aryl-alcohol dehydrogenase-like predicted oxidoreductase [Dinghuibacter silviterrae]